MSRRIRVHRYRRSCRKRSETLIVEPPDIVRQDRIYGELPDLATLWARMKKDRLVEPNGDAEEPISALLRRHGGNYHGRRSEVYWVRVWAVPLGAMKYAIYRQVGANRKSGRPRIMRVGIAVCPGLEVEKC